MRINNSIILSVLLWGASLPSANAQCRILSLDECKKMAVTNNAQMKIGALNIKSAYEEKRQAFTGYFPSISGTASAFNANEGIIKMELVPGQSMSLLKNGITAGITATQPIFAGGRIINSNKLTSLNTDIKKLQLNLSENEVLLNTEKYYWQIVSLKEKHRTLLSIQRMLDKLTEDVTIAVTAGVSTRNDLLQVQLKQNTVECDILNISGAIALSKLALAQYIGVTSDSIDINEDISLGRLEETPYSIKADHEQCVYQTNEYSLLEKNLKAQKIQQRISVGKNMPSLAVGAGYMYNNLMDKDESFGVVFATVSIPISDWWGGSHEINKHKAQIHIAETELSDNSELLKIRMQQSWIDLENAYKKILIAHKSIEQASENLRLNSDFYKAGTCSMSDLLEAQSLYQQSRDEYTEAYTTYRIKRLEYLQSIGQ